jgi:thiol:disulfide interchange protein DsbA
MLKMVLTLFVVLFASTSGFAAEPAAVDPGYDVLKPPHPTSDPAKVEVIEFFSYGCIHCYSFEPAVKTWLKTKPANVVFIRQPAIFHPQWRPYAKAYFTAESLGVLDKIHDDIYDAIHNKKLTLQTDDELAKFFADHGVKEDDFRKASKSFSVDAKLRQAEAAAPSYGIEGTPSLVVNGKYRIKASSGEKMFAVTDHLIRQELAAKASH